MLELGEKEKVFHQKLGRYLVEKKVDAVFGNPERENGGYHWVVAGS